MMSLKHEHEEFNSSYFQSKAIKVWASWNFKRYFKCTKRLTDNCHLQNAGIKYYNYALNEWLCVKSLTYLMYREVCTLFILKPLQYSPIICILLIFMPPPLWKLINFIGFYCTFNIELRKYRMINNNDLQPINIKHQQVKTYNELQKWLSSIPRNHYQQS